MLPDRVVSTICPYCGVGCALDLHIQHDTIYRVTSPFNALTVNHGNLCVKGRFGYDYVHAPDRLQTPLVTVNGETFPASWEAAFDLVAERLNAIRAQHGPDSIGFLTSAKCTNEENYLLQKIARGVMGTHNVDHCARL